MKATLVDNKQGVKIGITKIDFQITTTNLECVVQDMIEHNEIAKTFKNSKNPDQRLKAKLMSRNSAERELRNILSVSGFNWFDYSFWDNHEDGITEAAKKMTKKLFPDFY